MGVSGGEGLAKGERTNKNSEEINRSCELDLGALEMLRHCRAGLGRECSPSLGGVTPRGGTPREIDEDSGRGGTATKVCHLLPGPNNLVINGTTSYAYLGVGSNYNSSFYING